MGVSPFVTTAHFASFPLRTVFNLMFQLFVDQSTDTNGLASETKWTEKITLGDFPTLKYGWAYLVHSFGEWPFSGTTPKNLHCPRTQNEPKTFLSHTRIFAASSWALSFLQSKNYSNFQRSVRSFGNSPRTHIYCWLIDSPVHTKATKLNKCQSRCDAQIYSCKPLEFLSFVFSNARN